MCKLPDNYVCGSGFTRYGHLVHYNSIILSKKKNYKIAIQYDAYCPLVSHISQYALHRGVCSQGDASSRRGRCLVTGGGGSLVGGWVQGCWGSWSLCVLGVQAVIWLQEVGVLVVVGVQLVGR